MRVQLFVFIILSVVMFGCSAHSGSGRLITRNIEGEIFKEIDISGPYEVEIKKGNSYSVIIEADDNLMNLTDVRIRNNKLEADIEGHNFNNAHFKLLITGPEFNLIKGSASAEFKVAELNSRDKIEIRLSSASYLNGNADAPEINLKTSSAGKINIKGKTRKLVAEASSGSDIDAIQLLSENTTAKASSGSDISVHASVQLKASASSGGNIRYRGNADLQKNISSGGVVEKE